MQVLISDANILIDMFEGEILELMFQLPYEFAVSDMLYRDELTLYHERLPALGLQQRELTSASMQEALRLVEAYTNPSRYDCFSLALAKQEQCPLLTGDMALRKAAAAENIEVHGTLWLVEALITAGLLTVEQARFAYQQVRDAGSRLPWKEVEAQLRRLS